MKTSWTPSVFGSHISRIGVLGELVVVVELQEPRDGELLLREVAQALEGHLEGVSRKAGGLHRFSLSPGGPGSPAGPAGQTKRILSDPRKRLGLSEWRGGSHGETAALYPSRRARDTNREQV